jgi:hypothetical protein
MFMTQMMFVVLLIVGALDVRLDGRGKDDKYLVLGVFWQTQLIFHRHD